MTTGTSGANATTKNSFTNVSSIAVQYCTNSSTGKGSISIQVGENTAKSFSVSAPSSNGTTLKTQTFTFNPNETGKVKISVTCATNSVYIYKVTINTVDAAPSCDKKVTLTKGSETNGTFTLDKANGSYDNCDENFVVKVNNVVPKSSSQYCSGVNATGGNSTVTGPVDGVWTITYAKGNNITSTITPTFADKTSATVTLSEAGQEETVEGKYVGDSYTLPSTSTQTCGTKTFVGWSTETIAKSVNKPTTNFYEPGAEITLAESQTFYAVFAEGDGTDILTSITGGDWSNGIPTGTWSTKGTGTYSGNGVKFDDANDYVMSPDISSKAYTRLLLKFKSGHNGGEGSVLAFYVYNASNTLLTGDNITISPETVVPKDVYTSQQTIYQVSVSANEVIGKIMIRMDSKTKNLGMKYCELFGVSSSYQNYTTECTAPCTEPSLLYATPSVTKTVGDAAFINSLTNTKNVSVTYTSTNTSVATVANNGQVTILATGTTTIKATWEGNATYCEDEASYTLTVSPKTYTITIASDIQNGSISADKSSAVEGATIKLTATPNTGYKLDTWNVKDASNNSVSVNASGEFTMPASNVTISATFVSLPKLATPSNLSATEINPTSAKLSWEWSETTNTDLLNYYYLYIKKEGDANFTGFTYTSESCTHANLEPNTKYIWKVQAISKDTKTVLNSEESTESYFTTAALPTYTVSFSTGTGNPTQADITETVGGQGITLPVGPAPACTDWTFAGWAISSVAETTIAPTLLKANDKYQPTSNITIYAVYSKTEENGGGTDYQLVTSEPTEWSGTYLIVNTEDAKVWKGSATSDNGAIDVIITNNTIKSDETTDNEIFIIAPMEGGYSIKGASGKYISGTDNDNKTNYGDAAVLNTISIDEDNNVKITSKTSVLRQNNTSKNLFRYYKSSSYSSQHPIQLYKKGTRSSITTFSSNPDCTPPAEYTITWWANGENCHTQTAVEGEAIDVPASSDAAIYACDDKVFVGWVENEIDEATDEEPTFITDFDKITENKDYFAVFATVENNDESIFAIGKSGDFKIYAVVNGENKYATAYNNGKLGSTSEENSAVTYTFTHKGNNQYTIYNGSKYIAYGTSGTDLKTQSDGYLWHIAPATNGKGSWRVTSVSYENRAIIYNTSNDFKAYATSNITTTGYYDIEIGSAPTTIYSGYVTTCEATTETLSGKFSTGKYEYAEFATGNLQYKPSTKTWRFAKQQYQYVGKDNIYVGKEDYKGWIDLFGWSADGKFGVNPSNDNANYQDEFVDWGNIAELDEGWSTLSKDQWNYLLNKRPNYPKLKQIAMIGETLGIMLFPDEWALPADCEPTEQIHHDEEDGEDHSCDFVSYNYTLAQWAELEKAGAIFLPAAGRRTGGWGNQTISPHMTDKAELDADGHYKHYADYYAYYWTSTKTDGKVNYLINCTLVDKVKDTYTVHAGHVDWAEEARYGQSVRLAKVTSTLIEIGDGDNSEVITENANKTINVQLNRSFTANVGYYTLCLPFDIAASEIGTAYELGTITEYEANGGINIKLTEVEDIKAGVPYLVLPKTLTNPVFENVKIENTTGSNYTVTGAGVKVTFTGIINGGGQTNGETEYYVGDNGWLYNGEVAKLGLRAFFTITDETGNPTQIRARVVAGENVETGVEDIITTDAPVKVIENGQLIIIRDGVKYNVQGQRL